MNEAEAVNAQRDAHTDDVLERRVDGCPHGRWESAWGMWRCTICGVLRTGAGIPVRSLEEMPREGEMATQMDNILDTSMRLGGYPRRGGCGHGEDRQAGRISELERQRDAAIRAFDAEHALRLDVEAGASAALAALTEERDAARSDSADFRWLHGHALNRINAPSPWGRILPWLRGKDGR